MNEYMEALEELEETGTSAETPDTASGGNDTVESSSEENSTPEESDTSEQSDTPEESGTLPDADISDPDTGDLLERLDSLIEALTPEEESGEGEESESSESAASDGAFPESESSPEDSYNAQLLESVSAALASMQAENASYQEEILILQDEIITCEKTSITLLAAVGFFAALSCGNHFANSFFERMKVG